MTDPPLAAWNDGRGEVGRDRLRGAGDRARFRASCRRPSGSPCSTTTARCSTTARMPIQLDFVLRRFAEMPAGRPVAEPSASPGRRRYERRPATGSVTRWSSYYDGDDDARAGCSIDAILAGCTTGPERRGVRRAASDAFLRSRAASRRSGAAITSCALRCRWCELLDYLRANDFANYIASGGDRDFMRAVAEKLYGIPPRAGDRQRTRPRVLGRRRPVEPARTKARWRLLDDGPQKPIRIWSRIGRRPHRSPSATPTATSRCWSTRAAPAAPRCAC